MLCWISSKSGPAGLPAAARSLSMSVASAALRPASQGNSLAFFCPYPAIGGCVSAAGAARKKGEVVANARCPPPPVLPAQIRQRLSEGRRGVRRRRRRRSTGTMCPSHLSLPPHPPGLHNRAMGLDNTGTLIQTNIIKQLLRVVRRCSRPAPLPSHSHPVGSVQV